MSFSVNTRFLVGESNRIEGINRVTDEEIAEHERFCGLEKVTIPELERFVSVYQPNAKLRDRRGLGVYVGNHVPPKGGQHIRELLQATLDDANNGVYDAWEIHVQYETIHPFTDGNGRSGRALWYWMMRHGQRAHILGFLHLFYYQTLDRQRRQ